MDHEIVAPSILRPLAKGPSVRVFAVTIHLLLYVDPYNALDKGRKVVVIRSSFDLSFAGRDIFELNEAEITYAPGPMRMVSRDFEG